MNFVSKKAVPGRLPKIILATWVLVAGSLQNAVAEALIEESFDYPAGTTLAGQSGGRGFSEEWISGNVPDTAADTIQRGSLIYGDLLVSGNSVRTYGSEAEDPNGTFDSSEERTIESGILPTTTGSSLWFSFLVRLDEVGDGSPGSAGVRLLSLSGASLFFGARSTGFYGLSGGTQISSSTERFELGKTTFIALLITFNASENNERIRLFVNPVVQAFEPAAYSAELVTFDLGQITTIGVVSRANNRAWTIDEIRVGMEYSDVAPVPEPCSSVLTMLAGAQLVWLRRRRRPR